MPLRLSSIRNLAIVAAVILTLPMVAAEKRRVAALLPSIPVSGTVTDAATHLPLAGAQIVNGTRNFVTSDAGGHFAINLPGGRLTLLSVRRLGYASVDRSITPTPGLSFDFSLSPLPVVTVKLVTGETKTLDLGTAQFAYLIPLSGYVRSDTGNFCDPDGTAFMPAKSDIAKIVGPGVSETSSSCCTLGPVMGINLVLKNGQTKKTFFADSCFGYEVDFLGREIASQAYLYFAFKNIAEIDFP